MDLTEYKRTWYLKNKERCKKIMKIWRSKNRFNKNVLASKKKYAVNNKKKINIRQLKRWYVVCFGGNRDIVLARDNYRCTKCGDNGGNTRLVVHHIDGNNWKSDKPNHSLENLITFCNSCHTRLHKKKGGW